MGHLLTRIVQADFVSLYAHQELLTQSQHQTCMVILQQGLVKQNVLLHSHGLIIRRGFAKLFVVQVLHLHIHKISI